MSEDVVEAAPALMVARELRVGWRALVRWLVTRFLSVQAGWAWARKQLDFLSRLKCG